MLYNNDVGLYDYINPTINLKDLNRKQIKELAKEIANGKSLYSWQEVDNNNVEYSSKNNRQEKRFKRIFNKQLNQNLAPILEKQHKQELLNRMKSGDASAMSQWTTEGINKFGHQFMPVLLTAATLPLGIGAFGQAVNTIGLLPALGAEAGSLGLGYGGYKLGSKLDDDFGTNWIAPALSAASGIGGYGAGYKGMVKLGSKGWLPKNNAARTLYGDLFVKDVEIDALSRQLKQAPSKIDMDYYRDYNFLHSELTDPDRFVHVSPNPVSGKNVSVGAAHSNGINWVPGNAHVSKVGDDNMVWLWTGKPYRNRYSDQTFISIPKTEGIVQTRQPGAVGIPQIDLTNNATKIITKNPITGGFERQLVVSPAQSSKGSYAFFERPSKLTWEEKLGIPKGERNQPGKPRSHRAVKYDVTDGRPTKEFLDDYHTYVEALKTGGNRVDITDMFDSSWYRQRLLNQGLTEEQADQLILRLKDRVSPENLVVVDGLNSVRNFRRIEDGIPIEMTPERLTLFGRHTTGPGLSGKSLIELSTKADPEEIILHEIGGHRSQPLVADFKDTYLDQALTSLGLKRHMKIGKTTDYGLNWGEVRARALTTAKQMSDAGWNPNSPEQVNVWLNKHIFTNGPKNANQGALYYDRPKFIKAVTTGLKQGGKIK